MFTILCIILGIIIGMACAYLGIIFYEKGKQDNINKCSAQSSSKIIKADMERTKKLFKDKKFSLFKINTISIIDNWKSELDQISPKLEIEEVQEFVNYYMTIDKIKTYQIEINNHIDEMGKGPLKDYPKLKEYNNLLNKTTSEFDKLFNTDITNLNIKIEKLIKEAK